MIVVPDKDGLAWWASYRVSNTVGPAFDMWNERVTNSVNMAAATL